MKKKKLFLFIGLSAAFWFLYTACGITQQFLGLSITIAAAYSVSTALVQVICYRDIEQKHGANAAARLFVLTGCMLLAQMGLNLAAMYTASTAQYYGAELLLYAAYYFFANCIKDATPEQEF